MSDQEGKFESRNAYKARRSRERQEAFDHEQEPIRRKEAEKAQALYEAFQAVSKIIGKEAAEAIEHWIDLWMNSHE
jgi:hypothetical protein